MFFDIFLFIRKFFSQKLRSNNDNNNNDNNNYNNNDNNNDNNDNNNNLFWVPRTK